MKMIVKLVGFKVGKSRPTANKTIEILCGDFEPKCANCKMESSRLGSMLHKILEKSDFVSVRKVGAEK